MPGEDETPEITDKMKHLLRESRRYAVPPRETTIFSVKGVIGRYENPTSDLLRFFMSPDEGHDLGPLFLRAYFLCLLGKNCTEINLDRAEVRREVQTEDGTFIDLLISGSGWVLLIENKIRHWLANPFPSYEKHAEQRFSGKKPYFTILSPNGASVKGWQAISYQDYCSKLKDEFTNSLFDRPISKWQIFARDLIVHLENELYNRFMKMTSEQITFVETNLREIDSVRRLSSHYTANLKNYLNERLGREFPAHQSFVFYNPLPPDGIEVWSTLLCDTSVGNLSVTLFFRIPADPNSEGKYDIAAWVKGLNESQLQQATDQFERDSHPEDGGYWMGEHTFENRAAAVDGLVNLTQKLFDVWVVDAPDSPPVET